MYSNSIFLSEESGSVKLMYLMLLQTYSSQSSGYNKSKSTPTPQTKLREENPFISPNTATWSELKENSWRLITWF